MLFGMAVTMTVRMFVPTFALIALLRGGLVEDIGALVHVEHVAMLLRSTAYTCDMHGHGHVEQRVMA
jgi:hypothetical protein